MGDTVDYLGPILARKRREVLRRRAHVRVPDSWTRREQARGAEAIARLRRGDAGVPRVIAEIKMRSPSAGLIRAREPGAVAAIAAGYERGGAAAISVLCDSAGFGGSPLDLRRAAEVVRTPLLFKEFVLDAVQVQLARELGAS